MSSGTLGKLIATGRTAEICEWGDAQIIKLLRPGFDFAVLEREALCIRAVRNLGLPVPGVGEFVVVKGRPGLILDRVAGPSMRDTLFSRPWHLLGFARRLAKLHAAVHEQATAGLPSLRESREITILQSDAIPITMKEPILALLRALPEGDRVCHGDFHPGNVLLTQHGPTIIDWTDATRGNPLADVARTSLLITLGLGPGNASIPRWKEAVRNLFNTIYLRHYFALRPKDPAQFSAWQAVIATARLAENVQGERERLLSMVEAAL